MFYCLFTCLIKCCFSSLCVLIYYVDWLLSNFIKVFFKLKLSYNVTYFFYLNQLGNKVITNLINLNHFLFWYKELLVLDQMVTIRKQ